MNEFLNPKSMATPGVAGAMVMLVANAICSQFPEIEFRWAAIILSFFAGAIVFSAKELHLSHKIAFWTFNSLIIFSIGVGTSNIAQKIQQPSLAAYSAAKNTLLDLIIPVVHAKENSVQPNAAPIPSAVESQLPAITKQLILDLQNENKILRAGLAKLRTKPATAKVESPQKSNSAKLVEEERMLHQKAKMFEERKQSGWQQKERGLSASTQSAEPATQSSGGFFKSW